MVFVAYFSSQNPLEDSLEGFMIPFFLNSVPAQRESVGMEKSESKRKKRSKETIKEKK